MTVTMKLVLSILCVCICKAQTLINPTVTIQINTVQREIQEGGAVELKCDVTGLNLPGLSGFIVEWRRPSKTLVWNGTSYDPRYNVRTLPYDSRIGTLSQHMTLSQVTLSDTDVYACNLKVFLPTGGSMVLDSDNISLSIPHFPDESPICTPNGPRIVALNERLHLSCSSTPGYPNVILTVMKKSANVTGIFVALETDKLLSRETDITVSVEDDGVSFECIVTSPYHFPLRQRSCTIGQLVIYPPLTKTTSSPATTSIRTTPHVTESSLTSIQVAGRNVTPTIGSTIGAKLEPTPKTFLVAGLASSIVILAFSLTAMCVLLAFRSGKTHPNDVTKCSDEEDLTSRRSTPPFHILDFEIYNPRQWPRREGDDVLIDNPETHYENNLDVPVYNIISDM